MPVLPAARARPITRNREATVSVPDLYVADLTPDEAAAGFAVRPIGHPDGPPATAPAVVYTWGDPSHRLVKTCRREGIVFQLQAFGLRLAGAGPAGWFAERYWPGQYGLAWMLDRLREYMGRPGYRPLIDVRIPPADAIPPTVSCSAPGMPAVV
jgi:hypothetical protein